MVSVFVHVCPHVLCVVSQHRFSQSRLLPGRTSLRSRYGAAGWPASAAMLNTCALFLRTLPACPFSAAMDQMVSLQLSNLGSSRTSTAVSATWKLATWAYSGWWRYGLIATSSRGSSTLKWSGLSRLCHRCRSPTWWIPRMPGYCGTAWGILRGIRRMH